MTYKIESLSVPDRKFDQPAQSNCMMATNLKNLINLKPINQFKKKIQSLQ